MDYTKQRKQFGRPIAEFQVLQHRMVDMFIQSEQSVSMTYMATLKLGRAGGGAGEGGLGGQGLQSARR